MSVLLCARRQAAKAPECKSDIVSSSLTARSKIRFCRGSTLINADQKKKQPNKLAGKETTLLLLLRSYPRVSAFICG